MKHIFKICTNLFIITLFVSACNFSSKKIVPDYKTTFVSGSTNNKIEIIDFGGTGQPILFLSGLGNSAHVFVDFAPKFCDKFHVYAMTRRGFGASEQTTNGYGIDTLSKDILAVTKAMNFGKVILIGHSIAGDEITKFASTYPDKVDKIIYLDAAHDRVDIMKIFSNMPQLPQQNPTKEDSSSLVNLKKFVTKTMGVAMPDEELKATSVFDMKGKYISDVTSNDVNMKIVSGVKHPNYKNINCPALAIYARPITASEMFRSYNSLDSLNRKRADTCFILSKNWVNQQIDLFKKEVKNGVVKEINNANHYIFISHPAETENFIREFLK